MIDKIPNLCDYPINRACHDICLKLFKQLQGKEINLQEFLKEVAYVALRYGFDELRPRQYPQRIEEMVEYDNLAGQEKLNVKSEFWRQPKVASYMDTCHKVKYWNKHTVEWLRELITYIPQDDYSNQQKIKNRIMEFSNPLIDKIINEFDATEL